MITRCPACSTSFHVSAAQLAAASGTVRCGSCLHIFHAPDYQQSSPAPAPTPTLAASVAATPNNPDISAAPADPAARVTRQPPPLEAPPARAGLESIEPEPILLKARTAARWPRRLSWTLVNLFFALLLGLQYIYWNFEDLRTTGLLGPTLTSWCNQFRCPPPRHIDLQQMSARKLVVRSHTERPDALAVDFLLVNSAPFRQRLPALELRFSRLDGSRSALGRFSPAEYAGLNAEQLLQPREARRIQLAISDPGPDSLNYALHLLAPAHD